MKWADNRLSVACDLKYQSIDWQENETDVDVASKSDTQSTERFSRNTRSDFNRETSHAQAQSSSGDDINVDPFGRIYLAMSNSSRAGNNYCPVELVSCADCVKVMCARKLKYVLFAVEYGAH